MFYRQGAKAWGEQGTVTDLGVPGAALWEACGLPIIIDFSISLAFTQYRPDRAPSRDPLASSVEAARPLQRLPGRCRMRPTSEARWGKGCEFSFKSDPTHM